MASCTMRALVVLLLGPRSGKKVHTSATVPAAVTLNSSGALTWATANVGQPLLAGEQQRVGHAGVIDL